MVWIFHTGAQETTSWRSRQVERALTHFPSRASRGATAPPPHTPPRFLGIFPCTQDLKGEPSPRAAGMGHSKQKSGKKAAPLARLSGHSTAPPHFPLTFTPLFSGSAGLFPHILLYCTLYAYLYLQEGAQSGSDMRRKPGQVARRHTSV